MARISKAEPVAILLSTAVIVPFVYFLWKSLSLRVGDTWPMLLWPVGFAAAAINLSMLRRRDGRFVCRDVRMGQDRDRFRHRLRRRRLHLLSRAAL